jgi:hypothetical protein
MDSDKGACVVADSIAMLTTGSASISKRTTLAYIYKKLRTVKYDVRAATIHPGAAPFSYQPIAE